MLAKSKQEIIDLFDELEDFREDSKVLYPLNEILFLVITGILLGNEGWRAITTYGTEKIDFLRSFFPYRFGIPSKSTIQVVMSTFDPKKFEQLLNTWASVINPRGEQIAIDGKCLRGARSPDNPMYLLNAFATKQGLVIGQEAIGSKDNEITAIPALLDKINITGAVISVDAIGCQKKIADKIIEKQGHYFLALKGNQPNLYEDVKGFFEMGISAPNKNEFMTCCQTIEKGHGRVEVRRCYSSGMVDWLNKNNPNWNKLTSICCVESERHIKGKISTEDIPQADN
jgi:predicted transposase YbfD/YdcC